MLQRLWASSGERCSRIRCLGPRATSFAPSKRLLRLPSPQRGRIRRSRTRRAPLRLPNPHQVWPSSSRRTRRYRWPAAAAASRRLGTRTTLSRLSAVRPRRREPTRAGCNVSLRGLGRSGLLLPVCDPLLCLPDPRPTRSILARYQAIAAANGAPLSSRPRRLRPGRAAARQTKTATTTRATSRSSRSRTAAAAATMTTAALMVRAAPRARADGVLGWRGGAAARVAWVVSPASWRTASHGTASCTRTPATQAATPPSCRRPLASATRCLASPSSSQAAALVAPPRPTAWAMVKSARAIRPPRPQRNGMRCSGRCLWRNWVCQTAPRRGGVAAGEDAREAEAAGGP